MTLVLEDSIKFGVQGIYRRTGSLAKPWLPDTNDAKNIVRLVDELEFDSMWVGDHIAFAVPILDPITQLAWAAAQSDRLAFGTSVYLLPLRHSAPVAKQVAALDHLCGGRLIFGIGVGGEFPQEFEVCGVDVSQRGRRLDEGLHVLRQLWQPGASAYDGKIFSFGEIELLPQPLQHGGPPIWCGGRSDAALKRAGEVCDGYISYVVTPEMFKNSMKKIGAFAESAGREIQSYGTGHLLFLRIGETYESALDSATLVLSERYGMDFRRPAEKYCALGRPADVAESINEYIQAGVRHFVLDFVGPSEDHIDQIKMFASEVRPLIQG